MIQRSNNTNTKILATKIIYSTFKIPQNTNNLTNNLSRITLETSKKQSPFIQKLLFERDKSKDINTQNETIVSNKSCQFK